MNIHHAINIEDIRLLAKKKLPKVAFDFIDGGVDDEIGLRHNREAFKDYQLVPRYLRDVSQCKTAVDIFGQSFSMPIGISPMGLASLFKLGADSMMAHAAKKFNVPYVMSGSSNHSMEMVAKIADRAVQIHGGMGVIKGFPTERFYRDIRHNRIGEGSSEVQRIVIARELFKKAADTLV